jgi:hypothetical protein
VHVARFLCARLPGQHLRHRRLAAHQEIQRGMHGIQILKCVEPFASRAQLPRRLRPAQQQHAQHRDLMAVKIV